MKKIFIGIMFLAMFVGTAQVNGLGSISLNFSENDGNQAFAGGENIGPLASDSTNWNNSTPDRVGFNASPLESGAIANLKDDTGALTGASVEWQSSNVWWNADGTNDDEHRMSVGYLDDGDTGNGKGVIVEFNNVPYAEYRVYGLVASDNAPIGLVNVDVNGSWVLGGDATTTAPITLGVDDNFTVNGVLWTEIDGVRPGNYWTIDTSGANLSIISEMRNGDARGSLTGVIIAEVPEPVTLALLGLGGLGLIRRRRK